MYIYITYSLYTIYSRKRLSSPYISYIDGMVLNSRMLWNSLSMGGARNNPRDH